MDIAVRASNFPTRMGTADCSSYFQATVTPATVTITVTAPGRVTVTETIPTVFTVATTTRRRGGKRQDTAIHSNIPIYASACSGAVRYESACSCIGVTRTTITATTPSQTITITKTRTVTTFQPTATARPFILQVAEAGSYVAAVQAGGDYIAGFSKRESEAQLFYIDPNTTILKAIGFGDVGTYWVDYDTDFLWFTGIIQPVTCNIDNSNGLACVSGHFTELGTYAGNYSMSITIPGLDLDPYGGVHVTPKVIYKA
ncbi:hypothetical protein TWF694_002751 [Orbilia ellipsospora]|uniref:Uncharacterized protein n=1 Tax=Orbilia ellipsospora TaxID=2528407 RepID=A0AAV9X444_9PEZI